MDYEFAMLPFVVIAFVISIVLKVFKEKTEQEKKSNNQPSQSEQPTKLGKNTPSTKVYRPAETKKSVSVTSTVQFSDGHTHVGSTVEQYDPIEGSLGEVSTEGCVEMDGLRLISNDENFDGESNQTNFNLNKVAQAMVLGEILDNPRFKNPYGKK